MAVSYDPDSRRSKDNDASSKLRGRNSALLSDLTSSLSSNPFESSSGGVGVGGGQRGKGMSKRERELKELQEYEEDNYTRLTMSKKDSKRRKRDEEDLAMGGAGLSGGRKQGRIGAGMEEEFGDLLRGAEKNYGNGKKRSRGEDAYETLRKNHKVGLEGTLKRARGNGSERNSSSNGIESMGISDRKGKNKFDRQKKDFARGRK